DAALGRRRRAARAHAVRQGAQHHRHDRRDPAHRHRQEERDHHDRSRDRESKDERRASGNGNFRSSPAALPADHDDDLRRPLRRHAARHRLRLRRRPAPAARHLDHGRPGPLAAAYALHHACGLLVPGSFEDSLFEKQKKSSDEGKLKKALAIGLALLSGCAVGPDYERPSAPTADAYRETPQGWKEAQPSDAIARGKWWEAFGDAELSALVERIEGANFSLAAAEAQYRQAQAALGIARAPLLPTVDVNASAVRSHSPSGVVGGTTAGRTVTTRSA